MSSEAKKTLPNPSVEELRKELERVRRQQKRKRALLQMCVIFALLGVTVVLLALAMPVLRIQGGSMSPTLQAGDIVVVMRGNEFEPGDLIAFEYEDKILVKRVVALSGDLVDVKEDGSVVVNGQQLEESYVAVKDAGNLDIDLPCSVPENQYFVLGDERAVSVDSRSTAIGCVSKDQIIGGICLSVWPIHRIRVW